MYQALVQRDASFEGVFVVGVVTTGIFCRPTCPARKPKRENVQFFGGVSQAAAAGFRPCKRCHPLQPAGATPEWLSGLLDQVEADPTRRWSDQDLRQAGLHPVRVRRWFQAQHQMTFHGYLRSRRLGTALAQINQGADLLDTGYEAGFESASGFRAAFERVFGSTPGRARGAQPLFLQRLLTPLGPMLAGACDDGVCLLEFADRRMLESQIRILARRLAVKPAPGDHPLLAQLDRELADYFNGRRQGFDVPLHLPGTGFQRQVWQRLVQIPYGETLSYRALADDIGRPGAQRAVGRANGDNRLAVLVPCHRVVRSDGSLCGYGGGLWRKQALLDHEAGA